MMRLLLIITVCAAVGGLLSSRPLAAREPLDKQKILIVYFSKTNNTKTLAEHVHSIAGGDLLELKTVQPYPEDHNANVRVAVEENRNKARPELATVFPENMNDYDVIFVCYPVWEYTMPMAFFTFFDRYKFPGKTIIVFSTHLGSRLGGGPSDIAKLCPQANIVKGLAIRGPEVANSRPEVRRRLGALGWSKN